MNEQSIVSSYRLEGPFTGVHGSAWRARHLVSGELFLLRRWTFESEQTEYIEAMKRVSNLRHGNVRPILEFGLESNSSAWSITQIPSGTRVSEQLSLRGVPPERASLELVFGVSCALEAAHALGVYHGYLSTDELYWENGRIIVDGWGAVWHESDGLHRDMSALRQLVKSVVTSTAEQIRELMESPPRTAGGYRRVLASVLSGETDQERSLIPRSVDVDEDFNDETMETSSSLSGLVLNETPSILTSIETQGSSSGSESAPIDPEAQTAEHTWDSIALQDSWGLGLAEGEATPTWLDGTREELRASNTYDANHGSDWGVGDAPSPGLLATRDENELPSGIRVHTVITAADHGDDPPPSAPHFTRQLVIGLVILASVGAYLAMGSSPSETRPAAKEAKAAVVATTPLEQTPKATPLDPVTPKKTPSIVRVTFVPVNVTVTASSGGPPICSDVRVCDLPIDVNYVATHPGYQPHIISGDDLYDLRDVGAMRVVLKKKAERSKSRAKPR